MACRPRRRESRAPRPFGLVLALPLPAPVLEVAHQLLLLGVHRDHRLSTREEVLGRRADPPTPPEPVSTRAGLHHHGELTSQIIGEALPHLRIDQTGASFRSFMPSGVCGFATEGSGIGSLLDGSVTCAEIAGANASATVGIALNRIAGVFGRRRWWWWCQNRKHVQGFIDVLHLAEYVTRLEEPLGALVYAMNGAPGKPRAATIACVRLIVLHHDHAIDAIRRDIYSINLIALLVRGNTEPAQGHVVDRGTQILSGSDMINVVMEVAR